MPADTLSYLISNIVHNIPVELLTLAFRPRDFDTTVERRIVSEIVEGPILLDTNLVGGKKRDIYIDPSWEMQLDIETNQLGILPNSQSAFYKIPYEAREGKNISSVSGLASIQGAVYSDGYTPGASGNTATGLMSQMLGTYTFANSPSTPMITLEGANIIRVNPRSILQNLVISAYLEHDSTFTNMHPSAIFALSELVLCATKRYIGTKLVIPIDETEIVAGMEIGIIRELVNTYREEGKEYNELLIKFKGANHYDPKTLSTMIRYAI